MIYNPNTYIKRYKPNTKPLVKGDDSITVTSLNKAKNSLGKVIKLYAPYFSYNSIKNTYSLMYIREFATYFESPRQDANIVYGLDSNNASFTPVQLQEGLNKKQAVLLYNNIEVPSNMDMLEFLESWYRFYGNDPFVFGKNACSIILKNGNIVQFKKKAMAESTIKQQIFVGCKVEIFGIRIGRTNYENKIDIAIYFEGVPIESSI